MLNDSVLLAEFKEKYAKTVAWVKNYKTDIPKDYAWAVQWRVERFEPETMAPVIKARIVKRYRKSTKWVPLKDIEYEICNALVEVPTADSYVNNPAFQIGQEQLEDAGVIYNWANSKYISAYFPAKDGTPECYAWLKFVMWNGNDIKLRKWRKKNLEKLLSSGKIAWCVELNPHVQRARLNYASAGNDNKYRTDWFPFTQLHAHLYEANKVAYEMKWQQSQIYKACNIGPSVTEQLKAIIAESEERARKDGLAAEKTPKKDVIQDFGPSEDGEWNADLRKRYIE